MDRDEVEVHKNAKMKRGQYPAILTELAWSIIYTYNGMGHHRGQNAQPRGSTTIQFNLSFTTISTSKKMFFFFFFFFERVIKIVTQRKSKPCIWLSRSLIGLLPKMSVSRKQLPQECRIDLNVYIDGNTTSNVQLRQTFEQNYNHFTAKHKHWHLQ